jgi:hypothetical protein
MQCMESAMKYLTELLRTNTCLVRSKWGKLNRGTRQQLKFLTTKFRLSVAQSELQLLNGSWYVTHSGLIAIAERKKCSGISTALIPRLCDPTSRRWVFRAIVYKFPKSRGFVGFGDADPTNVSTVVLGAEMRTAETRAVNRALRKAYGIGLCSVEELGSFSGPSQPLVSPQHSNGHHGSNGSNNGQPRLRDQLCLLIRQHNLDPNLVKAYAADFCGTATLKEASRDLVESFIADLARSAKNDRDSLVCKLNSYAPPTAVKA